MVSRKKSVLIETLWNVNPLATISDAPDVLRINRNIVECK